MNQSEIRYALIEIISIIVEKDFVTLYNNDYLKRLNVDELQSEIIEYGGGLTLPPSKAFDDFDIYQINDNEINFDFNLWIDGEKSDLTLSCFLKKIDGILRYGVENIHIL
ncbi:DUF7668 domain-containing protein [Pinibacter aurantiacus]